MIPTLLIPAFLRLAGVIGQVHETKIAFAETCVYITHTWRDEWCCHRLTWQEYAEREFEYLAMLMEVQ